MARLLMNTTRSNPNGTHKMSERIKELVERYNREISPCYPDANRETLMKFAQEIVQECCLKLIEEGDSWLEFAKNPPNGMENHVTGALFASARLREDAVDVLKEHFGVE